jgi:hypothetical protein
MSGLASIGIVGNGFLQSPETVRKALKAARSAGPVQFSDVRNQVITIGVQGC